MFRTFSRLIRPAIFSLLIAIAPLLPGRCACSDAIVCCCAIKKPVEESCCCCCQQTPVDCCQERSCSETCSCGGENNLTLANDHQLPELIGEVDFTGIKFEYERLNSVLIVQNLSTKISHQTRRSILGIWQN